MLKTLRVGTITHSTTIWRDSELGIGVFRVYLVFQIRRAFWGLQLESKISPFFFSKSEFTR